MDGENTGTTRDAEASGRRWGVPRYDVTAPAIPAQDLGRVHVIAIGGAGMSAVARLLLQAGVTVSGSDAADSPLLDVLRAAGATVHVGHDASHVDGVDTVVVSSAIRDDNVELAAARAAGLRVLHRSQALASLMQGRTRVAVAGANGKTTTTSMLVDLLIGAGADPSYAIGGELVSRGTNAALGEGDAFVVEADESDGSFLAYRPHVAVVTNVQPDHLDFYGDFEGVQAAYERFAASVEPGGLLVACADDPGSRRLAERRREAGARVLTYGESPDADLRLVDLFTQTARGGAALAGPSAELFGDTRELIVSQPGRHNVLNCAAAALAAVAGLGADPAGIVRAAGEFRGVRRRFEIRGEAGGVTVVDDYAHNAGKLDAVMSTARAVAGEARLVVAFQPHLYSRTRDFASQFGEALSRADVAVVLDVYAAREDPIPGVSGRTVVDAARRARGDAQVHYVERREDALDTLAGLVRPGDLVVTVGAGDITRLGPQLLSRLGGAARPS